MAEMKIIEIDLWQNRHDSGHWKQTNWFNFWPSCSCQLLRKTVFIMATLENRLFTFSCGPDIFRHRCHRCKLKVFLPPWHYFLVQLNFSPAPLVGLRYKIQRNMPNIISPGSNLTCWLAVGRLDVGRATWNTQSGEQTHRLGDWIRSVVPRVLCK